MDFYLLDVKSTVIINGKDVAFDYINTYFEPNEAVKEAKLLSEDENVLGVSVHHWILKEDGTQEHAEDEHGYGVLYRFLNRNHREMR